MPQTSTGMSLTRWHPVLVALLVAPTLLVTTVFVIYPLLNGIRLSFTNASPLRPAVRYVGLSNFTQLLHDLGFYGIIWNSFFMVIVAVVLSLAAGLALALLLNQRLRGTQFFRTLIFQIWVVPWISVAILWGWIFNADYGIINFILIDLGILAHPRNWLAGDLSAQLVISLGFAWRMIPFMMVVSLAALQSIPTEVLEAASIDGATYFARLRFVVLPLIRNLLMIIGLLQGVKLFQEITLPWVLTQGGPGNATTTLSLYVYKLAFQRWNFGLASAVGTVWLVIVMVFALLYLRLATRNRFA